MKLSKVQKESAVNLLLRGETLKAIGDKYGVNPHQVQRACIRALGKERYDNVLKLKNERYAAKIDARNKKNLAEYETGVSVVEIAVKNKLSYRQIFKIVKK